LSLTGDVGHGRTLCELPDGSSPGLSRVWRSAPRGLTRRGETNKNKFHPFSEFLPLARPEIGIQGKSNVVSCGYLPLRFPSLQIEILVFVGCIWRRHSSQIGACSFALRPSGLLARFWQCTSHNRLPDTTESGCVRFSRGRNVLGREKYSIEFGLINTPCGVPRVRSIRLPPAP